MKKKFTSKSIFSILLVICMITVSGCGGSSGKTIPSAKKNNAAVTLTFISSWGGNDPNATTIQQILDKFTVDNPNITISNQSVFGDDFLPYLQNAFASGSDPDVFGLWPGSDINNMIAANKVADLTDVLNNDVSLKNSFDSSGWQYVTYNNKIYGLPMESDFEGLFVNQSLFSKYGAKIPTTFDELTAAVKIFHNNGITSIAYNDTAEGTYIYQNIAASIGGKSAIEKPFSSGIINNCYIKAMDDMNVLFKLGAFPTNYRMIDSNERNNLFISKKAAMIVQGSWFIGEVENDPDVDFVRFPNCSDSTSDASRMIYGFGNGVFHISQKAWTNPKTNQAALKLLKYITSKQSATQFASQTGMVSNVNIGNSINYNRLTAKGLELIKSSKELIGPPDSSISRRAWSEVIINDFPDMLEGKKIPADIWNDAVKDGANEN